MERTLDRRPKMNLKISAIAIIFALMVLGTTANAATKVELDSITVTLSENATSSQDDTLTIDTGDSFYIHIDLNDPDRTLADAKLDVKIKIGGVLVYSEKPSVDLIDGIDYALNISSDELNEDEAWDQNLMAFECGKRDVEVTVGGSNIDSAKTDIAKLKIEGDELKVKITPATPTVLDTITVTATDEDDDAIEDISVRFTNLNNNDAWDSGDDTWEDETDDDGEVKVKIKDESDFSDNLYAKYQVDAWMEGDNYCKYTTTLDMRHSLKLAKADSSELKAGQILKLVVTDDSDNRIVDAQVTISRTGGTISGMSDSDGYVSFQLNNTGVYSATAAKTGYVDSAALKITLSEKPTLNIGFTPSEVEIGAEIAIKVTTGGGSALNNAEMLIIAPDGTTDEAKTGSDGIVRYTPEQTGRYTVKINMPTYNPTEESFEVYRVFTITMTDKLVPNTAIVLTIRDEDGNAVKDAKITVKEAGLSGSADYNGKYSFNVTEPGVYTVSVKRDGYKDYSTKITVSGALVVKMNSKSLNIGDTVEFIVLDSEGNEVTDAKLTLTNPDGDISSVSGSYTAESAGKYVVKATKSGYDSGNASFEVKAYPLTIKSSISGTKITAVATSLGKPVSDIVLSFDAEDFHEEVTTDKTGKALLDIQKYNFTSVVISSKSGNYENATAVQDITPAGMGDSSTLLVILVALVILVVAIIAVTTQKEGRRRKEKGMLYRGQGSRLERGW